MARGNKANFFIRRHPPQACGRSFGIEPDGIRADYGTFSAPTMEKAGESRSIKSGEIYTKSEKLPTKAAHKKGSK
jgi:hypothetical protein